MRLRSRALGALSAAAVLIALAAWIGGQDPARPAGAGTTADPPLTDAMRSELGAAAWIRQDASYFSTTLRIGEQWKALSGSRAFQKLMALPAVQMARFQIVRSPAYQGLLAEAEKNPLLRSALAVASDALSREVFIYVGPELVSLVDAVGDVYLEAFLAPLISRLQGGPGSATPDERAFLSAVLAREKDLRLPPIVVGFRLGAPDTARSLLSSAIKDLGGMLPRLIEEEDLGGSKFHTLRFDLRMPQLRELREDIAKTLEVSVAQDLREKLAAFLDSQTLALSAGIRGEYLLLSVGATSAHLGRLGEGTPLAASSALAPVRRRFKPGVISLAYARSDLVSTAKLPADESVSALEDVLAAAPPGSLPEGLAPRLKKDVRALLEDLNHGIPEPAPWISVSFSNRGIESYSFSALDPAVDASRPLGILSRAGSSPVLAMASRSAPSREAYGRFAHWAGVAYGYFQDYVVPEIPPADRAEVESFRKLFVPAIKDLHEATEKLLLPALDGCQALLTVDGGGLLSVLPGMAEPLSRPLGFPRPALVLELNDAEKLVSAVSAYRVTLARFLEDAAKTFDARRVELHAPASRPHAGGTLFTYPLPATGVPDFEPHALVSGKHAVLSLSPAQSRDIIEAASRLPAGLVDLAAASGRCYWVDLAAASRLAIDGLGVVLEAAMKKGVLPPPAGGMIALHLPELREVLGALRSLSGRTWTEHGMTVHHSWLQVEDLSDG